jgi:uncharacterized protein YmfQ (DUF2313 family)
MSGARTADQVLGELLAISPAGDAMPMSADTGYATMLRPIAAEFATVEALMQAFATEINPLTATYLLADYERVLGPDPYGRDTVPLTIGEQQQLAFTRWTSKIGVRPADFIALAASFGVPITIMEYQVSTVAEGIGDFLVEAPTQFAWLVTLPTPAIAAPEVGASEIGDFLGSFPPSLVQPVIEGRAPAQTNPYFSYTG